MIRKSVRNLTAYVPGEQPRDPGIIKLNTNENPYPPPLQVMQALSSLTADALRRYPDPGAQSLREAIAEHNHVSPRQVIAGNGSDEILALCTRAFVEDDDAIGYFDPSYSLYATLAAIRNVPVRPVPLGPEYEWVRPPDNDTALFFLTHPNAPTGMVYSRDAIREFCVAYPGVVVIDEAYAEFAQTDCMDLALELDNVLVARTFSKSFSLAGIRVGYAIGAPNLIDALFKIKDSYNINALSQTLALAALRHSESMQAHVEKIRATRERLATSLTALGHKVYPSQANFLWVAPRGISARTLFERLREAGILIRHFPGPRTKDCVRITVGSDADTDRLLTVLAGPCMSDEREKG